MRRTAITLVKFGIVGIILYYLIQSGRLNFERLFLFRQHPAILAMIVGVLIFIVLPLAAIRWGLLLKALDVKVTSLRVFILTWIGSFFSATLPGAISGDLVKGYYIIKSQESEGKTPAFTTLIIDRFVGLFGLIVMAFFALIANVDFILGQAALHSLAITIVGLFGGTLLFYGIVLFPFKEGKDPFIKMFNRLPGSDFTLKVYRAFKTYQNRKPTLFFTLVISVMLHSCLALLFFQIAHLIGADDIALATQLFIMPIGLITIAIPIAPGGIGIGHAAFESLYHLAGVSGGADIFNLYVIVQLLVFLLGGIPYFLYSQEYKVPTEQEHTVEESK